MFFLENLRLSKSHSEINWPLACLLTFLGKKPSSLDLLHTVFPSQISSTAVKFLLDIQHNSHGKLFLIYFPLCLSRRLYIDENDITFILAYLHIRKDLGLMWDCEICHQKYVVLYTYSCNKITNIQVQISRQNWNGFLPNISHQMMI